MAAKLTYKIAIQLHPVAKDCTICSSRSRRPLRKLLNTLSYFVIFNINMTFIDVTRFSTPGEKNYQSIPIFVTNMLNLKTNVAAHNISKLANVRLSFLTTVILSTLNK